MKILSETQNSTARLFLGKSLFSLERKNIIITDDSKDLLLLKNFSDKIFPKKAEYIENFWEILSLSQRENGIFYCHVDIFRTEGNLYHIKKSNSIEVRRSEILSQEKFIDTLIDAGYSFSDYPEESFSYKKEWWSILIIAQNPDILYHIEWFDNEIDALIQISKSNKERNFINRIILPKKTTYTKQEDNSNNIPPINHEAISELSQIFNGNKIFLFWCDFLPEISLLQEIATYHFSEINWQNSHKLWIKNLSISNIHELIAKISNSENKKIPINIYTKYKKTIQEFLENNNISNINITETAERNIESFESSDNNIFKKIIVIADDILWKIFVKSRKKWSIAKNLDLLISLVPWDFVVHRDHGIGKFQAIIKKTINNIEREYVEIHYAENDKLFVPITEIFRISKYLGSNDIKLTRLSGKEWEKTISKTDEELQIIAENILETNAKRKMIHGHAFSKFIKEEQEFREKFPYEYTTDQLNGIFDVFADMESEHPMDRLLSGDVWFWKTEIAMNAAFKAVLNKTQVAVISPLVVLAMEHYESFLERFQEYNTKIALLSRMNTPKQTEKILEDMKNGNVDIVIGTHRLLSEDVKWKKLWLLIIDEEHKFGVLHKEKIKKIRTGIDILSLSATPIPRSLNLALSGLRQISLLTTPPKKKKPIETIITNWNESIVKNAIIRELERDGQVIIIHNRIRGIESLKQELEEILTDTNAKIIVTHGKLHWDDIEERIHDFKSKKYNILLTTTIIENGVNFLSSNTIIIVDPEEFWMANLHQLRWRVGRKWDQWYCYLAYRKNILNPEEKERLITIANNNHLWAGFEIAMRDMEIRGAGDILGIKQSWKSKDVGLPLYFRMLEEKISELKDEKQKKIFTKIELDLPFILQDDYFISELDKLNFYREVENIETFEELESLKNEFLYKDENIENLFLLLQARLLFWGFQIEKIMKIGNFYNFDFKKWHPIWELKKFLDMFDEEKRIIIVSPEKVRIEAKNFKNAKEFLQFFIKKV